jgi:starvation-inducible outer membrane lipoprotein
VKLALVLTVVLTGCAIVPQNRRGKLADPIMQLSDDATETYRKQKLYTTREGAAGGDGTTAGGGCGCQ